MRTDNVIDFGNSQRNVVYQRLVDTINDCAEGLSVIEMIGILEAIKAQIMAGDDG